MYQNYDSAQADSEPVLALSDGPNPTGSGLFQRHALGLFSRGYRVTKLPPGRKGPIDKGWTETAARQTRADVEAMVRNAGPHDGVGILTRHTPAVDIDIRDASLAEVVHGLAFLHLGQTVRRVGAAPKLMAFYRCRRPFQTIRSREFRLPDDPADAKPHAVEVLGEGHQAVAHHVHPETGMPYSWPDGELPHHDELPEITEDQAREFIAAAEAEIERRGGVFVGRGGGVAGGTVEANGTTYKPGTYDGIASALSAIPNSGKDVSWHTWDRIAMGIKAAIAEAGWPLFDAWSRQSAKYDARETRKLWSGIKPEKIHTCGAQTVYGLALERGWKPEPDIDLNPIKADRKGAEALTEAFLGGHRARQEARRNGEAPEAGPKPDGAPRAPEALPEVDEWTQPLDLFSEHFPTVITVDETFVPTALLSYARSEAARLAVDPAGLVALAAGTCSGVISDDWRIRLKERDSWAESARLWFALVARPGSKKTDQVRSATGPIVGIERELREKWAKEYERHQEELKEWENTKKSERGDKPKPPPEPRISFQDGTVESLSDILGNGASNKLLLVQDELSIMFGSFDRYQGAGKASSQRGHWLKLYDGGVNRIDRVNRGHVYVPNWSASIVGGIQTDKLKGIMRDLTDDGMLQRFAVIYPDFNIRGNPEDDDRAPDLLALGSYETVVRMLWKLKPQERAGGGVLTVNAGEGVQEERRRVFRLIERIEADPSLPTPLKECVSKWRGLLARLSLTFHLVRFVSKETPCVVTVEASTVRMAANFLMRVIAPSTFRLFREIGLEGSELVRSVAGFILAHGETRMSARDVSRAERKLVGDEAGILQTMAVLEHMGWARSDGHPRRPKWDINPKVHSLFVAKAQEEKKRREQAQELIRRKLVEFTA